MQHELCVGTQIQTISVFFCSLTFSGQCDICMIHPYSSKTSLQCEFLKNITAMLTLLLTNIIVIP